MCYANPPVDPVAREIHRVTLRHEVLAAVVSGRHVVLCDRTNLVRGARGSWLFGEEGRGPYLERG